MLFGGKNASLLLHFARNWEGEQRVNTVKNNCYKINIHV